MPTLLVWVCVMQAGRAEEANLAGGHFSMLASCLLHTAKLLRQAVAAAVPTADSNVFASFAVRMNSWVSAAARALRLLPLLAAAGDAVRQRPHAAWGLETAAAAADVCEGFAADAAVACSSWLERLAARPLAVQQLRHNVPALRNALWELHTASCRMVQRHAKLHLTPAIDVTLVSAWKLLALTGEPLQSR